MERLRSRENKLQIAVINIWPKPKLVNKYIIIDKSTSSDLMVEYKCQNCTGLKKSRNVR